MNLYEMTQAAIDLYAMFSEEEIDEQTVTDTLDAIGVEDKLEDYCKVIRQFEADAAAYKAEKDRFDAKKKRAENAIAKLEQRMMNYLIATGESEKKVGVFDIKVSQSRAAQILDENIIPAEYRKPQPDAIDKNSIRKALLAGAEIAGAVLQVNNNINIK